MIRAKVRNESSSHTAVVVTLNNCSIWLHINFVTDFVTDKTLLWLYAIWHYMPLYYNSDIFLFCCSPV